MEPKKTRKRAPRKPERMVVTFVVEKRNGKPHLQVFGESISLDNPSFHMLDMFHSLTRKHDATIEVNGKERKPDGTE